MAQWKQIGLVSVRMRVRSLASLSGLGIGRCCGCGVGRRRGSEPALLWLQLRLAAVGPIRPLAWELLHAAGAALKSKINK